MIAQMHIDGLSRASASRESIGVTNCSNGDALFDLPVGAAEDAGAAVESARQSFDEGRWIGLPPSRRKAILHRFADLVLGEASVLDHLDAEEMGKPVGLAFGNAASAAGLIRFNAEAIDKVTGDALVSDRYSFVTQRVVPRGVVAAIAPWNFPTMNAAIKLAPALAAGNSVVLKPSEMSSRSAVRLAELAAEAELPPGVLNVVPGLGETVGRALALHPDVSMIAFTGSSPTGKLVMQYAGQSNLKPVILECGGKSAQVVFDDGVPLEQAATAMADRLLTNQGQICSVGSRLLVQRSIEAPLVELVAEALTRARVGDATDPATTFGPVASAAQCDRLLRFIGEGVAQGGRIVSGGNRILKDSGGHFVEPTIFCDVTPAMTIAQQEIFGPVLAVIPFDTEDEAISLANGTVFGLTSYVWTGSLARGMRMAKAIHSSVQINTTRPLGEGAGSGFSSEPAKQSGFGVEGGMAGILSYMRRQLVTFNHD